MLVDDTSKLGLSLGTTLSQGEPTNPGSCPFPGAAHMQCQLIAGVQRPSPCFNLEQFRMAIPAPELPVESPKAFIKAAS